jgi:predicted AAA+ superfamily ATPase
MSERLKRNHYHRKYCNKYFWRTTQQQEIDYVEESDGKITGYEFKWNPKSKVKIPSTFSRTYKANVEIITKENFRDFV